MSDQPGPQSQPDQTGQQYPPQGGQQYPPQGGQLPPQPPADESKGIGGLIATIVVMLLVGGAIGYFVGTEVLDEDDDATEVSSGAPADTTTTAVAADPNTWAVPDGFQASMPEGWMVGSEKYAAGRYGLVARPSAPEADAFEGGGLTVSFDRRPDRTPEIELDDRPLPEDCTVSEPQPWTHGELTGLIATATACPGGFDYVRAVVTLEGGSLLIVSSAQKGLDEELVKATIDSFEPEAAASTQVAPQAGCAFDPSQDPAYPLGLVVKNHLDEPINFGWLNDQGQVENDYDILDGQSTGTYFTKQGDVFRATLADGTTQDYTATDAATQCVILDDTGYVPVP